MDHFTLINQLARPRNSLAQFLWGSVIAGITILIETLIWQWVSSTPYVLLPMAIILASFFGGGRVSGLTATLVLTAYSFTFHKPFEWFPPMVFLATGAAGSLLVDLFQNRIRDLTGAEIRTEEAQRLKFAAAAAKLGIWEWDIVNDILTWDDQMLEFYGIDRGSFLGRVETWKRGLHPEDAEETIKNLEAALRNEKNFNLTFRVVQPNGTIRTIRAHGLVLRDKNGTPSKMFGLNRDITKEQNTLKQMEELKAYFEVALVQSTAGIVIADAPSGLLRFVNPAALKIAGGDESVLVKDVDINRYSRWRITDLDGTPIPNEDLPLAQAVRSGLSSSMNLIFVRPSGEKRVAFAQTAPIRREDGSILSGITVFSDITEQYRLMEELKTAREAAEVAMRAKAKFLDIAAHELRTPVTAVSLLAQLTQRQVAKGLSADTTVLQRMRVQLDRLSRLVVDLLEVSKLDRGALELKCEPTDLNTLVYDCQSTFQIQYPDRDIQFKPAAEPIFLMMDPIRIYEVVANLLDNAVKYSPENSPIELAIEANPEIVRFSVRDHGPGLSEEGKKKLFIAFERGNINEKASGLGLGLFICRGIIGLHQGSIGVDSSPGAGSTFYFELPRKGALRKTGS